jgi:septum site-determining protein MinC
MAHLSVGGLVAKQVHISPFIEGVLRAAMTSQVTYRDAPFQLRGHAFTMMILKVSDPYNPNFFPVLSGKVAQAPNFFRNAPLVLDLEDCAEVANFDCEGFVRLLRNLGLIAIGVQGGSKEQQAAALACGLALLPPTMAGRGESFDPLAGTGRRPAQGLANLDAGAPPSSAQRQDAPNEVQPQAVAPAAMPPLASRPGSLIIAEPVRSGRQVYAAGGDLIVIGPVSPGAELLADGSIHVYGALRGRALAGVGGDPSARIFCHSLDAELVSIAGLYRVSEDFDRQIRRRPVQIYLKGDYLHIDPLSESPS